MAFTFTNQVDPFVSMAPTPVKIVTNYGKIEDEANVVRYSNKTAALDADEKITISGRKLATVNTINDVAHPSPVQNGVTYSIRLDEVWRETNTSTGDVTDYPIVMDLSVRHPLAGSIDNAVIVQVLNRLVSACTVDAGEQAQRWRFDDFMRSALEAVRD